MCKEEFRCIFSGHIALPKSLCVSQGRGAVLTETSVIPFLRLEFGGGC